MTKPTQLHWKTRALVARQANLDQAERRMLARVDKLPDLVPAKKPAPAKKAGRPPIAAHLQRVTVPLRLQRWLVKWIDAQEGTRADVIEAAVMRANKLKEPKE